MNIETFRIATASDSETIANLVNQAYRPKQGHVTGWTHESDLISGNRTSAKQIVEILAEPNSVILVGLKNSEIVACAHLEKEDENSYIGMLAVHPTLQNAGVGSHLLTHAERYAVEILGATQFTMVVISTRSELISFYVRRGYQRTGNSMDYPISKGVGTPTHAELKIEILQKPAVR